MPDANRNTLGGRSHTRESRNERSEPPTQPGATHEGREPTDDERRDAAMQEARHRLGKTGKHSSGETGPPEGGDRTG